MSGIVGTMMKTVRGEYVLIRRTSSGELYVTMAGTYEHHSQNRGYYSKWEVIADNDDRKVLEIMRDLAREANNVR